MKKQKEIIDFCKKISITEEQFYGEEEIKGDLDLSSLTLIPEGFNPTVGGCLDLMPVTSIHKAFSPTVDGNLYLSSLTSIPEGFNPTVGGSLDLGSLTSIPKGFNPIVGGCLYLNSLTSIPEGFNPTVDGSLYLNSLTSIPKGFNPTAGWSLYLNSLTSIPEGFNPTVGWDLYLNSLTSIPEGFNPTVGWDLYLNSLTLIHGGFNPIVGGNLHLKFNSKRVNNIPKDFIFSWQNGKYILVDTIFCELISKRGNVFTCKKINKDQRFYIVSDGEGNYSHGDTIKEAKEDLIFKISNRDKSEYEGLGLDSIMTYEEAIKCYRVITGACEFGTKDFCNNRLQRKPKYSIKEIIEVTLNEYGNKSFEQFFTK